MDPILTLPAYAIAFFVSVHLCETTRDQFFCRDAIERAQSDPRLAVYVDGAETLMRAK